LERKEKQGAAAKSDEEQARARLKVSGGKDEFSKLVTGPHK
jgi:hypothetical protein